MKKLFLAICAVAALGLAACHKENNNQSQGGGNQPEPIPTGEGIYNPAAHIVSTSCDDGTEEVWQWTDRKLRSITSTNDNGESSMDVFTYDGWRLSKATTEVYNMPAQVSYTYTGDKLSGLSITSGGMPMATADVLHSGDHITHLDFSVNEIMLQMLAQMIAQGGLGGLNFGIGPQMATSMGRIGNVLQSVSPRSANGGKFSINGADIQADLTWSGNNVSRMVMTAEIELGVTVEELQQMLPLDEMMGSIASLLSLVSAGQELPLTIVVHDTTTLAYDSHANPMQGLLGRLDPSILSANNVTELTNSGTMDADLTISVPILGEQHIPYSMPIGNGTSQAFTYTYNAAGFPATVENLDGFVTTYTYQE